jgi:di/tricarboxylate transporter
MFFLLAALLAMAGPGAILSTALIAPFAMSTGTAAGVPAFLIALMVGNGANAGNLSPFSTVGAIVSGLLTQAGLGGHEYRVWFFHGAAQVTVAAAGWALFGGLRLFREGRVEPAPQPPPMERRHALTLAVTGLWILSVVLFRWPLGWAAFGAAAVLVAMRAAGVRDAAARMPWKTIALVVGISTGVGMLERAGGLQWFQDLITRYAAGRPVHAVVAALTGAISAYSSTSALVLPAFLPMAKGLAERAGADAAALSVTIAIGSSLVDVSPLSTIGALCIAAAPAGTDVRRLYKSLLIWGLAMVPVGAALCYSGAPWFGR